MLLSEMQGVILYLAPISGSLPLCLPLKHYIILDGNNVEVF